MLRGSSTYQQRLNSPDNDQANRDSRPESPTNVPIYMNRIARLIIAGEGRRFAVIISPIIVGIL